MKSKFLLGCIALSTLFVISCEKSSEVPTADSDQAITNVTINATEAQDALASVEELENELLEPGTMALALPSRAPSREAAFPMW
ncbi:MAG: hypothetical protein IPJ09_03140 [Saprospiraceae bacterium]|nr:hypothetical protein [Saprospiraceae bacterium]